MVYFGLAGMRLNTGKTLVSTYAATGTSSAPPGKTAHSCYRAFDRQWIIADDHVIHSPRPSLWDTHSDSQIYMVEQHSKPVQSGPGSYSARWCLTLTTSKGIRVGECFPFTETPLA